MTEHAALGRFITSIITLMLRALHLWLFVTHVEAY